MSKFLAKNGIIHLTSPPHTPKHNGFSERRHRHLVETGLALLSHASIPISYWSYALTAATYLINHLPTTILSNFSPFECLNGSPPNYTKLRVFGCLCYPWLRPYTKHKLEARSTPCIFLGYSQTQSAYLCLDPSTNRIFISRHVQFHETCFPYSKIPSPSAKSSPSTSTLWFPPLLQVYGHSNSPSSAVESPPSSDPSQSAPSVTMDSAASPLTVADSAIGLSVTNTDLPSPHIKPGPTTDTGP